MKFIIMILVVWVSLPVFATVEFKILKQEKRYLYKKSNNFKKRKTPRRGGASQLESIRKQNEKIERLLSKRLETPLIEDFTKSYQIPTGTAIRAMLLNSIVSTNLESPVLVEVIESRKIPKGTRFSCKGTTKHKRVVTACDLMIMGNDEYEVKVSILNMDGSAGLSGKYYDGKEQYYAASVAASFVKGITESSKTRIISPFGFAVDRKSTKNKLIDGTTEAIGEASDILRDEAKTQEPVVFVNAGKKVLVYFNRRMEI